MKVPKYFYYRVRSAKKGTALEVEYVPDADVVEVVRCKDCRHFGENDFPYTLCHRIAEAVEWNDFCSYGERREGDGR